MCLSVQLWFLHGHQHLSYWDFIWRKHRHLQWIFLGMVHHPMPENNDNLKASIIHNEQSHRCCHNRDGNKYYCSHRRYHHNHWHGHADSDFQNYNQSGNNHY